MEEESGSQIGVKGGVGGGVGRLVLVDLWSWVLCLLCWCVGGGGGGVVGPGTLGRGMGSGWWSGVLEGVDGGLSIGGVVCV